MSKKPDRPKDMLAHLSEIKSAPSATSAPESATIAPSAKGAASAPSAIFKKHGVEIRKTYLEKLKDLAYWQRRRLRDVIDEALRDYLEGQEEPSEKKDS